MLRAQPAPPQHLSILFPSLRFGEFIRIISFKNIFPKLSNCLGVGIRERCNCKPGGSWIGLWYCYWWKVRYWWFESNKVFENTIFLSLWKSKILFSRWTYKPFGLDISELSDCTESEDDDPDARKKRIERLKLKQLQLKRKENRFWYYFLYF